MTISDQTDRKPSQLETVLRAKLTLKGISENIHRLPSSRYKPETRLKMLQRYEISVRYWGATLKKIAEWRVKQKLVEITGSALFQLDLTFVDIEKCRLELRRPEVEKRLEEETKKSKILRSICEEYNLKF